MKLRGNYVFMFLIQMVGGFWTYFACVKFGLLGVGYGFLPFLVAMILVQVKHEPDERERSLIQQTESIQGIILAVLMAVIYIWFPELNWFYVFVASISVIRGATGAALFLAR